ncbi:MAG TPA: crotonase/enoyl-CoA hydratase family protein [Acidimicrobiales bacterium]|nr:crotonase/enoyl-CoA hydratase family protein [Acidimicrobiales bacterium]
MSAVERERRGHVEILTINRPEARNAINGDVTAAMGAALDACADDDDCWVVVLTGSGDKSFSAGMDLKAFASGQGAGIIDANGFGSITRRRFAKPIIAAVNGTCLAGGCEIMLSCDLVVAADHAVFGIPEVKRGLVAGAGGLVRLPRRIPRAVALELALTGEPMNADRAYQIGLVNKVVPAADLMKEAVALAELIADNAPLAVRTSKKVVIESADLSEEDAWKLNDGSFAEIFSSADAMEGAVAFAEKRKPNWQGK